MNGNAVCGKIKRPQIAAFFTHRFSPAIAWVPLIGGAPKPLPSGHFSGVARAPFRPALRPRLTDNDRIAPESTASGWKHLAIRAIDWLEPDHNPAGVVYGTLIIGAVLATESVRRETLLDTVGGTGLALVLYWLAHSYAQTLGDRLERQVPLSASGLVRSLVRDRAIIRGASVPIIALLVASALGASLATAVLVAVWTSSTTILIFEVVAGVRAQLTGRELIVQICAGAVMGLAIIGLRTVLH
jgi:hypothetical protein